MPALVDHIFLKKNGRKDLDDVILEDISQIFYHILQATSVLEML